MTGLPAAAELKGWELTPRTDYLTISPAECAALMSARPPGKSGGDRLFVARTKDGGRTFAFDAWIVGPDDPHRAVMSSTVRLNEKDWVCAVRRRTPAKDESWIDAYATADGGRRWSHAARVADTGAFNGNPPALARLADGRLCCAYGERNTRQMRARLSDDAGRTWGDELVLRNDYRPDKFGDADFGYPRMVPRADGRVVTVYYWADPERPEPHIVATLWTPPDGKK